MSAAVISEMFDDEEQCPYIDVDTGGLDHPMRYLFEDSGERVHQVMNAKRWLATRWPALTVTDLT